MRRNERKLANFWIQFSMIFLLLIFLYMTYQTYPVNFIWGIATILITILGYTRQLPTVILVTSIIVFMYGLFILYQVFISGTMTELSWNDVIWLFIFPLMAMVGGINREDFIPQLRGLSDVKKDDELTELEQYISTPRTKLDDTMQFQSFTHEEFVSALQDCIMVSKNNQSSFTLLLIKINRFLHFEHRYGDEQTDYLLYRTASIINDVISEAMLKVYLEQGLFAIVMPGHQPITPSMIKLRLDNRFKSMMLNRILKNEMSQIQLIYGMSDFPLHGMDASNLYQQAIQSLDSALKEVKL